VTSAARRELTEALGTYISRSIGLPDDASVIVSAMMIESDAAVSLDELERFLRRPIGRLGLSVDRLRRLGAIKRDAGRRAAPVRGTPGLRDLLARLAHAYRRGGMKALEAEHWRRRERSAVYRTAIRIVQAICPLDAVAGFGANLDRDLETRPLWEAATLALSRLSDRWEIDVPDGDSHVLRHRPLVVYGNHPSMLTPFLVAAALERPDFKFVSCRYVARLIPNAADVIFPIEPTWERSSRDGVRGGLSHILSMAILYRFDRPEPPDVARTANRRSILSAAEHVAAGGASLIFPAGGGERVWYPGLGVLVSEVAKRKGIDDAYVVPVREENSSNLRLYRALSRRRRGTPRRRPIRLTVGRPEPLTSFGFGTAAEPHDVVHALRDHYERAFRRTSRSSGRPSASASRRSLTMDP